MNFLFLFVLVIRVPEQTSCSTEPSVVGTSTHSLLALMIESDIVAGTDPAQMFSTSAVQDV